MPTIRRLFGFTDDAVAGGSGYDALTGGVVPDATSFLPVTTANFEAGIERIGREDEVRGRRGATRPRPFRAAPSMSFSVGTYRSVVEKLARKCLGGTDTVTGSGSTPIAHNLGVLGFGSTALPCIHTQLVRDDLNHKMAGGSINRLSFSFPLDGEGTLEAEVMGTYAAHFASAAPTASFSGLSEDVMMLRDAQAYLDGTTPVAEVQTITITGTPTGGTFTLTYRGQTTSAIAYNAVNTAVDTALEALTTIGTGGVTVTGGPGPATPYVVTFADTMTDPDQLIATSSLTGGTNPTITVTTTTPSYGTAIQDLQGFDFSFSNNLERKWYAKRNVVTQVLGSPAKTYKLWFPQENKLGAAQDVTYSIQFGNPSAAQELARDYAQVQKLVFEVVGGPLATTPVGAELLRITLYNAVHTGGGGEALAARDDMTARFEGGGFYSEADSADIKFEVVNASVTPIT
jgi:hypothetical protein